MADGREVSLRETKLYNIERPIMGLARICNRITSRKKFFTVEQLLRQIGIDVTTLEDSLRIKLGHKVSQVCRAGSRFERDCICVQLYDDGYLAMKWAMEHGALFCITDRQYQDIPCLVVDNPTEAYAKLCKFLFKENNSRVVAIAGSIGKTTTKRMIECVLKERFSTFCDPDNENQIDCVGYMCQHYPRGSEVYVQEISEDTPNHIHYISDIISPEIGIITSIDQSHIEMFGSQEGIVKEIFSICEGMSETSQLIVNYDDQLANDYNTPQAKITVSIDNRNADIYAKNIVIAEDGLSFDVVTGNCCQGKLNIMGAFAQHNILSALYAYATALHFKMSHNEIKKGLLKYRTNGIRQNIIRTKENIVYADCYNAVASSIKSALEAAKRIPIKGKMIAVIGDVEEAGAISEATHNQIMTNIIESKVDVLFAYGDKMCRAAERYNSSFNNRIIVNKCESKADIIMYLKQIINPGDLIIFKASRKSELETIIKSIWPKEYYYETINRVWPIIKWRTKILFY